jgi:enoyl-CoA hydratase
MDFIHYSLSLQGHAMPSSDATDFPSDTVKLAIDGNLAIVTLNRPSVRNAIDAATARALERMVDRIESDSEVWAAIITGSGDAAFCAGADLREVAQGKLDATFTERGGFAGFVNAPRKKPWIAAVNGAALAGGFEIVLACDLVVACREARFGLPEVKRGLIASAGGLYRLPRSLPKAIARELILIGGTIDAEKAYTLGLINRLAGQQEVVQEARTLAQAICENAPLAVRASLSIARAAAFFEDGALRKIGNDSQAILATTDDYAEGSLAFLGKREPVWTGR